MLSNERKKRRNGLYIKPNILKNKRPRSNENQNKKTRGIPGLFLSMVLFLQEFEKEHVPFLQDPELSDYLES